MPGKGINKVKARRLKNNLLAGKSYKQAMIDAGYSEHTARAGTKYTVLQEQLKAIENDFKMEELTAKSVLSRLDFIMQLAISKGDLPTATRCEELKGKFLALFTERTLNKTEISTKDETLLDHYKSNRLFSV